MRDDATMNNKGFIQRRGRGQAGQSLIVAVIVLFLLLFLGGIFIALVARSLRSAGRAANVSSSSFYAEAGLRYLDEQLTISPEGADWRPVPFTDPDPARANEPDFRDPDYFWIQRYKFDPARGEYVGGFTRVSFGGPTPTAANAGGRALVRITYQPIPPDPNNPDSFDPTSKYLKLESVGRVGSVDARDPTTFGSSERAGLRRELVAFKAIGITDYVRSIWNKDQKNVTAALGAPNQAFDRPEDGSAAAPVPVDIRAEYRGPIRSNVDLTFYGVNNFYLDARRNDVIEVTGRIALNNISSNTTDPGDLLATPANPNPGRVAVVDVAQNPNPPGDPPAPNVFPSDSPSFTTLNGLVRDAPSSGDPNRLSGDPNDIANRNLRAVARIEPPVIDAEIGQRGVTRYRALTRDSAPLPARFLDSTRPITVDPDFAGNIGWGTGMYLNNRADVQQESASLFGAYSLRGDWLQPNAAAGRNSYWRGDFLYVPPAVKIQLAPGYMKLTQSPYPSRNRGLFRQPDNNGRPVPSASIIRYSGTTAPTTGLAANVPDFAKFRGYPFQQPNAPDTERNDGDFVIFAEGNVSISGLVGGKDENGNRYVRHLTVVSNGTIYIDGNLLRDNIASGDSDQSGRGESSIALLARDYVVVNTTQFLSPADAAWQSEAGTGAGPFFLRLDQTRRQFPLGLSLGPITDYSTTPPTENVIPPYAQVGYSGDSPLSLFFRHASDFTNSAPGNDGAAINLFVNPYADPAQPTSPNPFNFNPSAPTPQFSLIVPSENYVHDGFPLNPAQLLPPGSGPTIGDSNQLILNYDVGGLSRAAYKLTRVGAVPLDIRIEAILYAQEGSFFVIPGPWFNPDPNDTYASYIALEQDPASAGSTRPKLRRAGENPASSLVEVAPRFPFHREPLDIRLTIYGAVAENLPAQIGDQGAWMEKWGWVPRFYGSTGLPSSVGAPPQGDVKTTWHGPANTTGTLRNPGVGLVFEFNDNAILPYQRDPGQPDGFARSGNQLVALRKDAYGRTLPMVPRLPVARGLLYQGENPLR